MNDAKRGIIPRSIERGSAMKYAILEANMERLMKKITRIRNKCNKYGCDFTFEEVGEEFRELKDEHGANYTARFVIVDAEGTAIVNGWKFIASVEHTEKGNIINRACDIEVPEWYYTSKPVCEHCHSNRYRKDTFIVMNEETGEFKQVGKSCLFDFTHGMSAEGAAAYTALFDEIIKGEAPSGNGYGGKYYDTKEFLQFVCETINHLGYVKYDPEHPYATTTKEKALDYYTVRHGGFSYMLRDYEEKLKAEMKAMVFTPDCEDVVEQVEAALAWIAEQDESSNYIHNLKTACSLEYVEGRNLGIITSLFPTYNKDLQYRAKKRREAKEAKASEYVGEIGKRIEIDVKSVKVVTSWETDWGITKIYKITDTAGNVFIWKTGTYLEEDGDGMKIKATVKDHKEYNGCKQTEIIRCRVAA